MLDRVNRRYAQQEADAAVRRRATPLAKDAAAPALGDDAVHGQEVRRVAQVCDQPQLVVDLVTVAPGDTVRKARIGRLLGQASEGLLRRTSLHDVLVRILILDLAEVEAADPGDVRAGLDRVRECGEATLHLLR